MSAIDTNSPLYSAQGTSADGFGSMTSTDFVKVMFAELTRQDPLQPSDTKDLLQQLSTIRGIESDLALQTNLKSMIQHSELTSAGSLIGKFAIGMNGSGDRVSGYVDAITVTRNGIELNLSTGHQVPFSRVEQIIDPSIIASPAAPPPPPPPSPPVGGNGDGNNTPPTNNGGNNNTPPVNNDDDNTPPVDNGDNGNNNNDGDNTGNNGSSNNGGNNGGGHNG